MKTKLLYLLLAFSLHVVAQQRDTLHGRVMVGDTGAPGIFVINKNTGAEVKTVSKGLFKIMARNGDKLVVYSDKTVVREFYISTASFKNMPYEMAVEAQSYQLDEVVIDGKITSESLGLVPEGQKQYTVAERRLKTAGEFKPEFLFLLTGGIVFPLDPIINAITGRTKMLKKELVTERKIMDMENINYIYSAEDITTKLDIPTEKVQGFLYFAVEDPELKRAIKNKNDERAKLELAVLAIRYLEMQKEAPQAGAAAIPTDTLPTIQKPIKTNR